MGVDYVFPKTENERVPSIFRDGGEECQSGSKIEDVYMSNQLTEERSAVSTPSDSPAPKKEGTKSLQFVGMDKLGRPQTLGLKTAVRATARKHSQIARRQLKTVLRTTPRQLLSKSSTPELPQTRHPPPAPDSPSAVIDNFIVPIRQGSTISDSETKIGESIIATKRSLTQSELITEPQSQLNVIPLPFTNGCKSPQFDRWQSQFAKIPYALRLHNYVPIIYIQSETWEFPYPIRALTPTTSIWTPDSVIKMPTAGSPRRCLTKHPESAA